MKIKIVESVFYRDSELKAGEVLYLEDSEAEVLINRGFADVVTEEVKPKRKKKRGE